MMKGEVFFIGIFFVFLQAILASSLVYAASTGDVTATVTPKLISVTVSPSSVSYGTMPLSGSSNPVDNPTVIATNNGTVNENFGIRGANATAVGGSGTWTLAASTGNNQYVHYYGVGPGYSMYNLTTGYANFVSGVLPAGTSGLHFRIALPDSITGDYVTYSTTVTIQATE